MGDSYLLNNWVHPLIHSQLRIGINISEKPINKRIACRPYFRNIGSDRSKIRQDDLSINLLSTLHI